MASLFLSFLLYSSLSSAETKIYTSTNYIFVEVGVSNELSHTDANIACFTSYNTSLATIKTEEEQNEVATLINGADTEDKWIGAKIINTIPIWVEDNSSAQVQISATWHPSEDNFPDDNQCVAIQQSDGEWTSMGCDSDRDYICNRYPPTSSPTTNPTTNPSITPTQSPTTQPTILPTIQPSVHPTVSPSINPTMLSQSPSKNPTISPTKAPTLPNGETMEKTTNVARNEEDLSEVKEDSWHIALILLIICGILVLIICILIGVYCSNKRVKNKENMSRMSSDKRGGIEMETLESKNILTTNIDIINSVSSPETTIYDNNTQNEAIDLEHSGDSSDNTNAMYENGEIEQIQGMTDIGNNNLGFYAIALSEYIAVDDDQLNLKENDIFYILETLDSGWWFGCNNNGKDGWFPSNYLRKCNLLEQNKLKQEQKIQTKIGEMDRNKYINIELPPVIQLVLITTDDNDEVSESSDHITTGQ